MGRDEVTVLDTHAWFWWMGDRTRLSRPAFERLKQEPQHVVSIVSCWEIAMLVNRGRLVLDRDPLTWIHQAMAAETSLVPLLPEVCVTAPTLAGLRDPFDQLIVATALYHRAPLITKDDRIRESGVVETIW